MPSPDKSPKKGTDFLATTLTAPVSQTEAALRPLSFGDFAGQPKTVERLQVMLAPDELKALDDWRFRMRMPTRAAAIRELLRLGLADRNAIEARAGEKSSGFGVKKKAT